MAKLPAQKFFAYSGGKPISYEWQPPDVPDPAGTDTLAHIHEDFHRWILQQHGPDAFETKSRISLKTPAVRRLLSTAFFASLRMDEGRPTRATLYVESSTEADLRVFDFASDEELTDSSIARLAPILDANDAALVVNEREGKLMALGIAHLDDRHSESQPLVPPQGWVGRRDGLFVIIRGPGLINLRQGYCDYTLERNKVVGHVAATAIPLVDAWLCEVQKSLLERAPKTVEESPYFFREDAVHQDLDFVLSKILGTAASLRHGAAIVIPADANTPHISINYRTAGQRSLSADVLKFWTRLGAAYAATGTKEAPNELVRCERSRHAMLKQAVAVGRLTAADGCVVLDRTLQLRGFGGIIDPTLTPEQGALQFVPPPSDQALTEAGLLRRFGTRHRSAYLLCKFCPGTLAFVLSQDGGWRVFASDPEKTYFYDHVSP